MNDFIQACFPLRPAAAVRPDPLLPVRRSFGEDDAGSMPPLPRLRPRHRAARPRRAVART